MSEQPHSDDELDDELEQLSREPLRVEAVVPESGELVSGTIFRDHWAQAQIERDERR